MENTFKESNLLDVDSYRKALIIEMEKLGGNEQEIKRIKDATINNAIRRNRKPEDVAWALLQ